MEKNIGSEIDIKTIQKGKPNQIRTIQITHKQFLSLMKIKHYFDECFGAINKNQFSLRYNQAELNESLKKILKRLEKLEKKK